jgi:uncharacterized membrane protein YraQ (UPF0718 family)
MTSLILSILTLFIGPIIYRKVAESETLLEVIDGFIFVSIAALVMQHILPASAGEGGFLILCCLLFGFIGPNVLESRLSKAGHNIHTGVLLFGVIGLALHAALDGAALVTESVIEHADGISITHGLIDSLPIAIILHRLPVGLTLWFLIRPNFGRAYALIALLALSLMTTVGYFGAEALAHELHDHHWLELVQAFAAGAILHVVVFRFHLDEQQEHGGSCCGSTDTAPQRSISIGGIFRIPAESVGNILGLLLVASVFYGNASENCGEHCHSSDLWGNFYSLLTTSAPALLLAYVFGGLLYAFTPSSSINWLRRGGSIRQFLKGMIVGLPLPVCSCGVLPLYESLARRGAPAAAAFAFLLATPELGIDALLISVPLLGLDMTITRVLAVIAFTTVVVGLILYFVPAEDLVLEEITEEEKELSLSEKFAKGVSFGLISLVENTGAWILVGLLVAALMDPLIGPDTFGFSPALEVIACAIIGAFMYVCAAGSTPFVAILMANGLSAGAAIAFLLTGPATNISTFGVLGKLHGKRTALTFSIVASITAIAIGILINVFFSEHISPSALSLEEHQHHATYEHAATVALLLLFAFSVVRIGARAFFEQVIGKVVHAHS